MKAATFVRRASTTILKTAAPAVFCVGLANAAFAQSPQPETQPTPAYMFLDLPSSSGHAAVEFPLLSFSYDAQTAVPLSRRSTLSADDGDVRGTILLAPAAIATAALAPKTTYSTVDVVQTDANRATVKRLTFHDLRIATVGPAGDEPATRVTFTARTVTIR